MPAQVKKILAVMTDLFFSVKISDTAKKFAMQVEFVKDGETLMEKLKDKPSVVFFDLNYDAVDHVSLIEKIKADPATKRISTVGFVSHVNTDLKIKAQNAGCDMVVARSVFATNLPVILKRHATITVSQSTLNA